MCLGPPRRGSQQIRANLTPVGGAGLRGRAVSVSQIKVLVTEALDIVGARAADVLDRLRAVARRADGRGGAEPDRRRPHRSTPSVSRLHEHDIVQRPGRGAESTEGRAWTGSAWDWPGSGAWRGGDGSPRGPSRRRPRPSCAVGADELLVEAVEDVDVDGGEAARSSSGSPHLPAMFVDGQLQISPSSTCTRRLRGRARRSTRDQAAGVSDQGAGRSGCGASRSWRHVRERTSAGGSRHPPQQTTSFIRGGRSCWRP